MKAPQPPPDWKPIQPGAGNVPIDQYEWDERTGATRRITKRIVQIKPPERPL